MSSELVLYFRDFFLDERVERDELRVEREELRLVYELERLDRDRLEEEYERDLDLEERVRERDREREREDLFRERDLEEREGERERRDDERDQRRRDVPRELFLTSGELSTFTVGLLSSLGGLGFAGSGVFFFSTGAGDFSLAFSTVGLGAFLVFSAGPSLSFCLDPLGPACDVDGPFVSSFRLRSMEALAS